MAVVQISKIQLRRGRKLVSGMPQLASGEMAWAIDTQELYIGNGAVGEGAPAVGNTKILTENDTLLDLANQYQYKANYTPLVQTGVLSNFPVQRTLQDRLDEGSVNAASFGIKNTDLIQVGENADQTAAIQNAIYSLYLDNLSSPLNKVNLEFDPGVYEISGTVYVPSNVRIVGSGVGHYEELTPGVKTWRSGTVFNFVKGAINNGVAFTVNGTSVATAASYENLATTTVSGTGTGARVTVVKTGSGISYTSVNTTITIIDGGSGYTAGTQIRVAGNLLGGSTPANDLTITLSNAAGNAVFNTTTVVDFVNETSTRTVKNVSPTTFNNQAKQILLKDFTISTNSLDVKAFNFENVRDSVFDKVRAVGVWESSDGNAAGSTGLEMTALSSVVTCQNNKFSDVQIEKFSYGVFSNTNITNNTFENCLFKSLFRGVGFGIGAGISATGPVKNLIKSSRFELVNREAFIVSKGYDNRSQSNTFINVGSDAGGSFNTKYSPIVFTTEGNSSLNDSFDRAIDLENGNYSEPYVAEVQGRFYRQEIAARTIQLPTSPSPTEAFRIPLTNETGFEVDYVFSSSAYSQMRKGKLHIAVDPVNNNIQLVDDCEYVGTESEDSNIIFTAGIATSVGSTAKSVLIFYRNLNVSDTNNFTYTYSVIS